VSEHLHLPPLFGEFHRVPADLLELRLVYDAPQRVGDELPAQTDAQNRLTPGDAGADEPLLGRQPRILVVLVDVHGTAHDDEQIDAHRAGQGARPSGVFVDQRPGDLVTAALGPVLDPPDPLIRHMLQVMDSHPASLPHF
jgi:hypothetical protein